MATSEQIRIIVNAEVAKAVKELNKVDKSVTGIDKTTNKYNKTLGSIRKSSMAWSIALVATAAILKKTVEAASNLEEVQGKFNVVFGESPDILNDANRAVENLRNSYAMSEREARQYMSSVQDLLVPMGMMPGTAATMSESVVQLAADLGSFNNVPTQRVMEGIQSALVGNYETMKAYGVVLNETVVKEKARAMGLWNGVGAIDASTKAQVAFKIMTEGSSAALGNMEQTSNSFANVQKKLESVLEDVQAEIGSALLPSLGYLMNAFADAGSSGNILIQAFKSVLGWIGNVAKGLGDLVNGLSYLTQNNKMEQFNKRSINSMNLAKEELGRLGKKYKLYGKNTSEVYNHLRKYHKNEFEYVKKLTTNAQKYADTATKSGNKRLELSKRVHENQKLNLKGSKESATWAKKSADKYINNETKKQNSLKKTSSLRKTLSQQEAELKIDEYIGKDESVEIAKEKEKYTKILNLAKQNGLNIQEVEEKHQERMAEIKEEARQMDMESMLEGVNNTISASQQITGQISAVFNQLHQNQSIALNNEYKRRKKYIMANVKDEAEQKKQLEALDEEFDKKKSELARKQAIMAKRIAIVQAIQNTASAVTKALAQGGFFGGPPMAAVVGALGAAQVALIARQPIPEAYEGGIIPGSSEGTILRAGERNQSEAIIPLDNEGGSKVGGDTYNVTFNVESLFADDTFPTEIAEKIDGALYDLYRNSNSRFGEALK